MDKREVFKKIAIQGHCYGIYCSDCPFYTGDHCFCKTPDMSDAVGAAKQWLLDNPEESTDTVMKIELRDYFASHALSILSGMAENGACLYDGMFMGQAVKEAYHIADMMLKVREE